MIPAMRHAFRRSSVRCACFLVFFFAFFAASASHAAAKSYSADRFDATVRVLPDGTLDVTETVVFRFESGTFREVFREIPVGRTDGIEIVRAEMEGVPVPFGTEAGTVEVRQRNGRVRAVWRFRPVADVTRTFVLNYRVKGVVRQENGADLLIWRGTPGAHAYEIATSRLRFELPVAPSKEPRVNTRRTGSFGVQMSANTVEITATSIGKNGWIDTTLRLPARSVLATPPLWQQRAARLQAQSLNWIAGAATVVAAGFVLCITRVTSIEEDFEIRSWQVQTEQGARSFQTLLDAWPHSTPKGDLVIEDVAGDLYLFPPLDRLDPKSKQLLWPFID